MITNFRKSLSDAGNLRTLYTHCVDNLKLPGDYSDLLRMSLVYCLSAFDKLIHDIILHEMVEVYVGRRPPTPKYLSEPVSFENHSLLVNATVPPAEIIFEGIVRMKLNHMSFMDPVKLADGLSLIWDESHKWQVIASQLALNEAQAKTELKNLFKRRNAIVHEGDRDPSTADKLPISLADVDQVQLFIGNLGEVINRLI